MKVLFSLPDNKINHPKPAFKKKKKNKAFSEITEGLIKELSKNVRNDALAQKIKKQVTDPAQKNIFFAAVASLITAAAAQITEILIGDSNKKDNIIETQKITNADGDTYEASPKHKTEIQFAKHKGRQADFEINLINIINQVVKEMRLGDDDYANLVKLYNKFCGINYKGEHYSQDNEPLSNGNIAKNLIKELMFCNETEKLNNIIVKYNQYTTEPAKEPDKTDPETIKIIKYYKNLSDSYIAFTKQKNDPEQQQLIENFIKKLYTNPIPKSLKQAQFTNINTLYCDNLYALASLYNEINTNTPELTDKLFSLIGNKKLSNEALLKWNESGCKYYLNFFEYNSMIRAGIDDDSIKELAKQKRNTKLNNINIIDSDNFIITPPFIYTNKNFYLINNIFKLIHKNDNYTPLSSNEPEVYTIDDIESEIKKHSNSYPNLKRHLSVKNKEYLNQGKMQNLLDLYYGDKINKSLFTLHSYLRFIERIVIPTIDEYNGLEDANYCNNINKTYIAQVKELKEVMAQAFKEPIEIQTYSIGDVKAPQFTIPMTNSNGEDLLITINNENKIHTIF